MSVRRGGPRHDRLFDADPALAGDEAAGREGDAGRGLGDVVGPGSTCRAATPTRRSWSSCRRSSPSAGGSTPATSATRARACSASIREAVDVGKGAGLPVHISHLKVTGKKNWGLTKDACDAIEAARGVGPEGHGRPVSVRPRRARACRRWSSPTGLAAGERAADFAWIAARKTTSRGRSSASARSSTSWPTATAALPRGSPATARTRRSSASTWPRSPGARGATVLDVVLDIQRNGGAAQAISFGMGRGRRPPGDEASLRRHRLRRLGPPPRRRRASPTRGPTGPFPRKFRCCPRRRPDVVARTGRPLLLGSARGDPRPPRPNGTIRARQRRRPRRLRPEDLPRRRYLGRADPATPRASNTCFVNGIAAVSEGEAPESPPRPCGSGSDKDGPAAERSSRSGGSGPATPPDPAPEALAAIRGWSLDGGFRLRRGGRIGSAARTQGSSTTRPASPCRA